MAQKAPWRPEGPPGALIPAPNSGGRVLKVLDIFSGIGGFSLGLERTGGFQTVAFCEIEPYCRAVLRKHWPDVPIFEDVTKLEAVDVGSVDVICGGFPCQDISVAGKQAGIDGERSGLWGEYARLIGEIQPRYAIVENVSALLHNGMGRVLGDLAAFGYDAEWECLPTARPYGHFRERVFIVAYPVRPGLAQRRNPDPQSVDEKAIFTRQRFAGIFEAQVPAQKWADRPLLGRGIPRVPSRMDRVAALGNAVVPQVVEVIGRAILESGSMPYAASDTNSHPSGASQ